ncbi:hypothetical protein L8G48_12450 [Idiomarina sp. ATCH4]|nr:hypothetical protein [Idiomarina sp. ATCH4]
MAVFQLNHPSSILSLEVAQVWHLLIDETGSQFSAKARDLPESSHEVGKVVGLLLPEQKKLPQLPKVFHATQSDPATVHHIVSNLIQHRVGIIGATVKNEELEGYGWINTVELLTRWILTLLPASGKAVTVKVFIEQRAPYSAGTDMRALAETLQNEMRLLSPKRLGQLNLRLEVIDKAGHLYNGYVDSLAYLWGSPKLINKRFLESSGLNEQCLIEDDSHRIERLFLALNHRQKLEPEDWYAMSGIEPKTIRDTALSESLQTLGEYCKEDYSRWLQYLVYSQQQQQQKSYHPYELYYACQWLARHAPADLPPLQRLQLLSIQLSASNHMGKVAKNIAKKAETLADQLLDEDAQLCCEVALRIIVTYCNAFEFGTAKLVAEQWLRLPKIVLGKENYAKLLSSAGQVYAFLGDLQAEAYFEESLSEFAELKDLKQAQKQCQQTRHYQALWLMDSDNDIEVANKALSQALATESVASLRNLAVSLARGEINDRFTHYLLLRACIKIPNSLASVARAYWSQKSSWQKGLGHPWALINFYRALILWQSPLQKSTDEAIEWATEAVGIAQQQAQGSTLMTISEHISLVRDKMQCATPQSYTVEQIMREVSASLPFAFH